MWLCTSRLLSAKVEGDWIGTTFFRTFFLRCSFCYPKPVKSSILKYKMGVLISSGQLRCCNACLDREIVPGHDTNLILFVPSTAVMYFPFFFTWNTFLYPGHRDPAFCDLHRPPKYLPFLISSKILSTELLTDLWFFFNETAANT